MTDVQSAEYVQDVVRSEINHLRSTDQQVDTQQCSQAEAEGYIVIESSVQELAALNQIHVLKPLQHSKMMRSAVGDNALQVMRNQQWASLMNPSIVFSMDEFVCISAILKGLSNETASAAKDTVDLFVISDILNVSLFIKVLELFLGFFE
ncbi:hypothetical protein MBANPS3_012027 [Mucor bainieri]